MNETQRGSNGRCCRNGKLHLNVHARVELYGSSPGYTIIFSSSVGVNWWVFGAEVPDSWNRKACPHDWKKVQIL
jgi:hypothetical protein